MSIPPAALISAHPPKPRLTLRVGLTGHRPHKLDTPVIPRIHEQLGEVFAAVERAAGDILKSNALFYTPDPAAIRLVCGFAEGADQIAVEACPAGWQIEAILPFPRDEYLKDFVRSARDGADIRAEFLASLAKASTITELALRRSGNRDQGYADAGGYMLRQIDLLIAVWDGLPPRPGGAGALAREACAGGIPVVWISTREEKRPRLISGFDDTGAPVAADADCTEASLNTALHAIFAAPAPSAEHPSSGRAGLERYLAEHWRTRCVFAAYDALSRIANGKPPRLFVPYHSIDKRRRDWDAFLQSAPGAPTLRGRIAGILLPRFIWADTLAVHYSHLYRSAYVLAYCLSAVAVFIALGTVFIHDDPDVPATEVLGTKAVFVLLELIVTGAITVLVWLGRHGLWHERWLHYRAVAETIRHGRFLSFVSEFGRIQEAAPQRERPWMLWYIRATMREVGLPTAILDETYQKRLLRVTLADEIAGPNGQMAYHAASRDSAHRVDHFLHRLGAACFVLTSIILFVFLVMLGIERALVNAPLESFLLGAKPFLTFASAGLPALGAAVAGIRVHGDFEGSGARSNRMVAQLGGLKDDYAKAMASGIELDDTAQLLIATAGVMSEDLAAWQELYGRKRLALPA